MYADGIKSVEEAERVLDYFVHHDTFYYAGSASGRTFRIDAVATHHWDVSRLVADFLGDSTMIMSISVLMSAMALHPSVPFEGEFFSILKLVDVKIIGAPSAQVSLVVDETDPMQKELSDYVDDVYEALGKDPILSDNFENESARIGDSVDERTMSVATDLTNVYSRGYQRRNRTRAML
jgi:hypothetical protein